jgi:16S rRNA (adenine1518-N6/adenine1519-N6)-dimethyltransferase
MRMLGPADIRALAAELSLRPTKSRGQNFVVDANTVRRIAREARVGPSDTVLEIGPGLGSLTLALLETGANVTGVEVDPVLADALPGTIGEYAPEAAARFAVVHADAVTLAELPGAEPTALVANLPYNVAVPILLGVLDGAPTVRHLWVMVQAEVAERLCAPPGGRTIGVPTIKVGWYASARIAMSVSPEVFTPRPRVRSAVVELHRRPPPSVEVGRAEVFGLVDRAYGQRRKMLRATLGDRVPPAAFAAAGVDPRARPEQLSVADWAALASAARH